jgi:hypothetical protein
MKLSRIDIPKYRGLLWQLPKRWKMLLFIVAALFSVIGAVFGSYYFHVERAKSKTIAKLYLPDKIGKPFPHTNLVDEFGNAFDHNALLEGRAIIVLLSSECDACLEEGEFLDKFISSHDGIKFYGVVVFGSSKQAPSMREKFPFKLFYDKDSDLRLNLGIKAAPTKLLLENGIIRKVWVGTTNSSHGDDDFIKYIEALTRR